MSVDAVHWLPPPALQREQHEQPLTINPRGAYDRKFGSKSRKFCAADGHEFREWSRKFLEGYSRGEIAEKAQCTKRTAENVRAGKFSWRAEYLIAMCRNDPTFRAAFFEFCGGNLVVPPDLLAALNKYANWQESQ